MEMVVTGGPRARASASPWRSVGRGSPRGGHVRAKSGLVVAGVNAAGVRAIRALEIGDREAQATWGDTFAGLVAALAQPFPGATWQRGQTPFTRNLLTAAPKTPQPALGRVPHARPGDRRHLGGPGPRASCRDRAPGAAALRRWAGRRVGPPGVPGGGARAAAAHPGRGTAERGASAAGAVHPHLPPPEASARRRLGAVLLEIHEPGATGRRYLNPTRCPAAGTAASPATAPRPAAVSYPQSPRGGGRFYTTFST